MACRGVSWGGDQFWGRAWGGGVVCAGQRRVKVGYVEMWVGGGWVGKVWGEAGVGTVGCSGMKVGVWSGRCYSALQCLFFILQEKCKLMLVVPILHNGVVTIASS